MISTNIKLIGERIKYARSLRNYTLDEIANDIGVAKSTIQRYENGLIGKPKIPVLDSIAKSLNVNPSWISGQDVPMERATMADIDEYKNKMIEFSKRWNIQYFEKKMLESFSRLSDSNKEKAISYTENLLSIQQMEEEQAHLIPRAAHERTDIKVTDEMRQYDDELMRNDDVWK